MLSSKYWITNCILLTLLAFSVFTPALVYAAPLASSEKDWQYVNGNSWAQNFSPQTQINKDNVQNLEVKWVFPIGSKALAPALMQTLSLSEGSNTPPIVRNGVVYITTNYMRTYAIDAKTGKALWTNDYTINTTAVQKRLPVVVGAPHFHGIRYWEGGNAILMGGIGCDFYGIDATTGKTSFWVQDLCLNIPGNLYSYRTGLGANAFNNIGTYEKGKQFIVVLPGSMHSGGYVGDARHVTMGIDMNTKQVLWKVFSFPPQDVPTKDWALQECDIGYFQTYTCNDVKAKNQAGLEWDWAQPNQPPSKWGGVTANWGQAVVDEDTGILYTQTGNQGPYPNVTLTPGPRLYGSTIMAIDLQAGKRIWWLQPFPHDPFDYDCNWSGILADVKGLGKVYMKGCKEGRLYVMDAKTGKPYYVKDVINDQVSWGQIKADAAKRTNEGGVKHYLSDPFSYYDMREWGYPDNGKYCGSPCVVLPSALNGIFATDMSYNPTTQTLYHYANTVMGAFKSAPMIDGRSVSAPSGLSFPIANTSIVARDAVTGNTKWTYFYQFSAQRSHIVVTGGLVFTGFTDGNVRFIDESNGKLLKTVNLGAGIVTGPTIGKDSDGNSKIFVSVGATNIIVGPYGGAAYGSLGSAVPGTLIALGLSGETAKTSTVTTTATTTATTTSVTTASTTITSATTQTLTTTSATTVTTTQAPKTQTTTATVTSNAPAQTVTATKEVTQTAETIGPITYAAIGIAVIALIAAALVVMRKK
ncbi:MAG: PQQ-binding-like beta-propeller repeat protein [Thaumarchaeota archaeon]|nr:PQQ-binding-like beta-propeller repeat protein [Nitrososphaerota archaeon]MCL5316758.1 PQQ-binding-like beta-propeller repeat protein [Nitrososphaerota archaeon]